MIRILLTLFAYFCIHTISFAQDVSPTFCKNIIGTLRNLETDEIIKKGKVVLEQNGEIVAISLSDEKGNYTFENIEHGLYNIKTELSDYDYPDLYPVAITSCETQYVDLDLYLSNIVTLGSVLAIDYIPPQITDNCCFAAGINTEELSFYTSVDPYNVKITPRTLPGPAKKNPQKPIKELNIFPNPSFGLVNIELTFETLELRIFDMLGHNLGVIPFQVLETELVSIDLSHLPPGTYALQLKHEEGTDVQKLVLLTE